MIISLSGLPGAGKSFVAIKLAEKLGWPHYNMGGLRRQAAAKRGMTIAEYNQLGETDPSTDLEVDEYQRKLGQTEDDFIIEGRTSWYFIPQSIKIFLTVDAQVGAKRIFKQLQHKNNRNEGIGLVTVADVIKSNVERITSDQERYAKYFGIDAYNEQNFDYVLDTSKLTPEAVVIKVWEYIQTKI
jgi:predicted cytidylate kinase